jgi:tRNA modification GTPase
MTATRVAVLTPPGGSAVAVVGIRGPDAWCVVQDLFRTPKGAKLGAPPNGFRFGRFGSGSADEVILSTRDPDAFEVHTHGGRQVVDWLLRELRARGLVEVAAADEPAFRHLSSPAGALVPFARTVRTAGILLDQAHGAHDRAVATVEAGGPDADAMRAVLKRNARVGRHLIGPWKVAIAGPPNAGKSSLLNALAGFDRSIVSPIPGTTRDAISVSLAFDGWPVDLFDTAGLRDAPDDLEREGVSRARTAMEQSDLVLWVVDAAGSRELPPPTANTLIVFNKTDVATVPAEESSTAIRVSAVTRAGIETLIESIVAALVPIPPLPGEPVPYTNELCDRWAADSGR